MGKPNRVRASSNNGGASAEPPDGKPPDPKKPGQDSVMLERSMGSSKTRIMSPSRIDQISRDHVGAPPPDSLEGFCDTKENADGTIEEAVFFETRIGKGGMGEVYSGSIVDKNNIPIPVAIKVYRVDGFEESGLEKVKREFLNEARTLAYLSNQDKKGRIVKIIKSDALVDGRLYYAMEYLEGRNIEDILKKEGEYSWEEAKNIIFDICEALAIAHEIGIVHRDLKPSNIILQEDYDEVENLVKIIDFGLARDVTKKMDTRDLGLAVGTPEYMAPEQARGEPVDARTDVYAFGAMIYDMLSCRSPIQRKKGENDFAYVTRTLITDHVPLSELVIDGKRLDIPQEVSDFIDICLKKDPNERFESMRDVRLALKELIGNGRTSDSSTPSPLPGALRGAEGSAPPPSPPAFALPPENDTNEPVYRREAMHRMGDDEVPDLDMGLHDEDTIVSDTKGEKKSKRLKNGLIAAAAVSAVLIGGAAVGLHLNSSGSQAPINPPAISAPAIELTKTKNTKTRDSRPPVKTSAAELIRDDSQPAKTSPTEPLSEPPIMPEKIPEQHRITIKTGKAGIGIYLGGEKMGVTSEQGDYMLSLPASEEAEIITFKAPGIVEKSLEVVVNGDQDVEVTLEARRTKHKRRNGPRHQGRPVKRSKIAFE